MTDVSSEDDEFTTMLGWNDVNIKIPLQKNNPKKISQKSQRQARKISRHPKVGKDKYVNTKTLHD